MDVSTAPPPEGINAYVLAKSSARRRVAIGSRADFSSTLTERSACKSGGDVNMKCQVADEEAVI